MRTMTCVAIVLLPACGSYVSASGGDASGGAAVEPSTTASTSASSAGSGGGTTSATSGGMSTGSGTPSECGQTAPSGPTECPPEWTSEVNDKMPCAMPPGTTCAYAQPNGWQACTCGCTTENEFSCYGEFGGPNCPASPPATGSSCASTLGISCPYYPDTMCTCLQNGTWQCMDDFNDWPCASPSPVNTSPSGVVPDALVKDLSDADRTAWCSWYMNAFPPGGQLPPDYPAENGYAWGGATMGCSVGCVQHLKVEHCVQNLGLGACAATLGELEDCVRTIMNSCQLVGHGCGPLHACGCDTTIVQGGDQDGSCKVPVQ